MKLEQVATKVYMCVCTHILHKQFTYTSHSASNSLIYGSAYFDDLQKI